MKQVSAACAALLVSFVAALPAGATGSASCRLPRGRTIVTCNDTDALQPCLPGRGNRFDPARMLASGILEGLAQASRCPPGSAKQPYKGEAGTTWWVALVC